MPPPVSPLQVGLCRAGPLDSPRGMRSATAHTGAWRQVNDRPRSPGGHMIDERTLEEEATAGQPVIETILDRPIRDLPALQAPIHLPPPANLRAAIATMYDACVGCVLVVAEGRLGGIFTERDVLTRVVGTGVDLDLCPVADLMTREPEC